MNEKSIELYKFKKYTVSVNFFPVLFWISIFEMFNRVTSIAQQLQYWWVENIYQEPIQHSACITVQCISKMDWPLYCCCDNHYFVKPRGHYKTETSWLTSNLSLTFLPYIPCVKVRRQGSKVILSMKVCSVVFSYQLGN